MANAPSTATTVTPAESHSIFASIAGELIGVAILAIFADLNDDLGKVAVAIMGAWFLIFIMTNVSSIQGLTNKI